jgi:phosphoribosylformylglycinamidine synthase
MKAYVYVSLKKSVLDPQGKTIQGALNKMGYKGLHDIRQGKYFEISLNGGLSKDEAQAEVEKMAREVLTNPVIEEFRYSLED